MNWRKFVTKKNLIILVAVFLFLNFFMVLGLTYCYSLGIKPTQKIPLEVKEVVWAGLRWSEDLPYFFYKFKSSDLPVYDLYIDQKDLKKLSDALPTEDVMMRDANKEVVSAKFVFKDKEYKVKTRYRGAGPRHWAYSKKSWRVKLKKDSEFINGRREFSFIIPHDRGFQDSALESYAAGKMGLVNPFIEFAILRINGESQGVYAVYEHWGEELLEKNSLSGDANLYGEMYWDMPTFEDVAFWKKFTEDAVNQIDNFAEVDLLIDLANNSSDEEFYAKIFDLVDEENFYRWQVHDRIYGTGHQDDLHNIRLYFNNTIGKFQFIPWDAGIGFLGMDALVAGNTDHIIVNRILKNPEFLYKRNTVLWEYIKDGSNLEDDLRYLDEMYKKIRIAVYNDKFIKEQHYTAREFDKFAKLFKTTITDAYNTCNDYLNHYGNTSITVKLNYPYAPIVVDLITDGFASLELAEIEIKKLSPQIKNDFWVYYDKNKNGSFEKNDLLVGEMLYETETEEYSSTKLDGVALHTDLKRTDVVLHRIVDSKIRSIITQHRFFVVSKPSHSSLPIKDIEDIEVDFKIKNSITSDDFKPEKIIYIDKNTFAHFDQISESASKFITRYPEFRNIDNKNIVLYAGSYVFYKDIIVPKNLNLEIKSGATLYFNENVSLISYSPVKAVGAKFLPLDYSRPWGVFGVVDVEEKSSFDYTVFEKGGDEYLNGIYFSGMLALHRADVEIKNSQFKYATGDDGLNVKYAEVSLIDSKFIKNEFDGVDLDFVAGEVSGNQFLDSGNDGIDISGSDIKINKNIVRNSGDKGISIGEKSSSLIEDNSISNCDIGIAVKDLSAPEIKNNEITENRIGIATYQKKQIFGGAFPKVWNTTFNNNEKDTETDKLSTIEFYD